LIAELGISDRLVEMVIEREQQEIARLEAAYRGDAPALQIRGRTLILVDDGIATGATMRAAVTVARQQQPKRLVITTPVVSVAACAEFEGQADETIYLHRPEPFFSVGAFYRDFHKVLDDEVRIYLQEAATRSLRRSASIVSTGG